MFFSLAFSIDENVIEVYNNKNVKFFYQNLVDVALKRGWFVGQSKKHHLVLKVVIMNLKSCLLFIAFSDSHPMIDID